MSAGCSRPDLYKQSPPVTTASNGPFAGIWTLVSKVRIYLACQPSLGFCRLADVEAIGGQKQGGTPLHLTQGAPQQFVLRAHKVMLLVVVACTQDTSCLKIVLRPLR